MVSRLLLALAVVAVALAGCSAKPAAPASSGLSAAQSGTGAVAAAGLAAAPHWKVGQWWDHHWYFGPEDTSGFMVKAIVVTNGTDGYRLATDDPLDAASHASFYFHDQGLMGPDWAVHDFGGAFQFPWYSFPLSDGKTWTAHEENLDFNLQKLSQDLTFKATAINGTPGAFNVEAHVGDGLRARYDYQPSLGWFSEYRAYSPGVVDPELYNVRMVNEGQGQAWSGTYYTSTADFLLNTLTVLTPAAPSPPPPPSTFAIKSSHTHVLAIPFVFAAGGASDAAVAPDQRHWDAYQVVDASGNVVQQASPGLVFVPAAAGDWRFATAGAGAFVSGGGCFAWGVTMTQATL